MRTQRAGHLLLFGIMLVAACLLADFPTVSAGDRLPASSEITFEHHQMLPLVINPTQPTQEVPLKNGDFEQGISGWQEYSLYGYPTILPAEELPVSPHSGQWAAWLGGAYGEINGFWQPITVSADRPILSFYYWLMSEDECGNDEALVTVDLQFVVDSISLCHDNNTAGWALQTVDLSNFAGQTVDLDFFAGTNDALNSNFFVDDVSFTRIDALPMNAVTDVPDADSRALLLKTESPEPLSLALEESGRGSMAALLLEQAQGSATETGE